MASFLLHTLPQYTTDHCSPLTRSLLLILCQPLSVSHPSDAFDIKKKKGSKVDTCSQRSHPLSFDMRVSVEIATQQNKPTAIPECSSTPTVRRNRFLLTRRVPFSPTGEEYPTTRNRATARNKPIMDTPAKRCGKRGISSESGGAQFINRTFRRSNPPEGNSQVKST